MEMPKRIFAGIGPHGRGYFMLDEVGKIGLMTYIRADLVERLIGYASHRYDCKSQAEVHFLGGPSIPFPCTCGLSDLIKEVKS